LEVGVGAFARVVDRARPARLQTLIQVIRGLAGT
jgi:hypothetical protein